MKQILCAALLLGTTVAGFSQRYTILSGDLKNLKGISEFNVVFDYADVNVHGFASEREFLESKKSKRTKPGEAEKFESDWFGQRKSLYEPKFIAYFNKRFEKQEVQCRQDEQLKYTMQLKTTWIYPGYFAEPSKISAIFSFFETAHPNIVLFSLQYEKSIGIEYKDFTGNEGERIAGAYEKLAKNIVMQLKRL